MLYSQEGFCTIDATASFTETKTNSESSDFYEKAVEQENVHYSINPFRDSIVFRSKNKSSVNYTEISKTNNDQAGLKRMAQQVSGYRKHDAFPDSYRTHLFPAQGIFLSFYFNRDYTVPSIRSNYILKICLAENNCTIKIALDHLYFRKDYYYNSKSLDYCFSHFFSVRPPPSSAYTRKS